MLWSKTPVISYNLKRLQGLQASHIMLTEALSPVLRRACGREILFGS
jgi:hypothetical protein